MIPDEHLTGYSEAHSKPEKPTEKMGAIGGLFKVLSNSYAFGMFWLLCSFELISVIINYRMQCLVASQVSNSVEGVGTFLLSYTFIFQVLGALLALFGTTKLLKDWGIPFTIMVTPVIVFGLSLSLIFINDLAIITLLMVSLRTLDYSLDVPAREILFIPTTYDIQYQARGWISSFGKTLSKTSASLYNGISVLGGAGAFAVSMTYAPLLISITWLVAGISIG
jgi:ATP/ADP translocase